LLICGPHALFNLLSFLIAAQVASKIVCMSWTSDGMLLALGMYDGSISVRDKAGTEKHKFAASSSPVWSIAWSPQVSNSTRLWQLCC
jgi:intraflagellar transport protein 122